MSDTIHIKLPDNSVKEVAKGTTALDIAKSISPRLASAAIAAQVRPTSNGDEARLVDLTRPLEQDGELRILTEKDPERRERALEFQRTVDKIFNLGGFRGEDEENPIQLARRFRELAGFTDEENDSLSDLARKSTEEARAMAEMATAVLDAQSN